MRALALATRRFGGLRAANLRLAAPATRTYATPPPTEPKSEEIDPQLTETGYPDIPKANKQYRSPLGWQDPQMRRNFDEPVRSQQQNTCQTRSASFPSV